MNTVEMASLIPGVIFDVLGDTATYMPKVGRVRTTTVFAKRHSRLVDGLGATRLVADGQYFEIAASALTVDPQPGDMLRVFDTAWNVRSARRAGIDSEIWLLDCTPHAQ